MTTNLTGAYPIDPTTPTGLFRTELGDTVPTLINDDSTAEYGFLGDTAIAALITAYPLQPTIAMARATISMANQMIAAAENIAVSDIKINTIQRAQLMLESANSTLAAANIEDVGSVFSVVPSQSVKDQHPYTGWWNRGTPRQFGESGF